MFIVSSSEIDSTGFDADISIEAVKNHPVIWNTPLPEYHDKIKEGNAWKEVCLLMCNGFGEKSGKEQNDSVFTIVKMQCCVNYPAKRFYACCVLRSSSILPFVLKFVVKQTDNYESWKIDGGHVLEQAQDSILKNYDLDEEMSVTNFSDDSIVDPDFDPEIKNNCNNRLRSLDSSLDSVEETINDLPQMDNPVNETASTSTNLQPPIERRQKENRKHKRLTKNDKVARDKEKHPMKPSCAEKCNEKCGSTFSEDKRFRIWEEYWLLDYSSRRKWLAKNVQAQPGKCFAKSESRKFFFSKDDKKLCAAMKKSPLLAAVRENRSTTENYKRKRERTIIMNHINKFKPCITHYRRHNAPNMRYLSKDLTVQSMFDDFEQCETYKNKSQAKDVDELTFLNDEEWKTHKNKAEKATDKYHEDAMITDNQNVRIYSMDLQKMYSLIGFVGETKLTVVPSTSVKIYDSEEITAKYRGAFYDAHTLATADNPEMLWSHSYNLQNGYSIVCLEKIIGSKDDMFRKEK
ncbi:hypothetical protein JTB14_008483 [Gonioctena quinquepunctata]|nr:hypothetical protein JTB14_008483 [Gonioctena quinquepunctata]